MNAIKKYRDQAGLTQANLAEQSGLSLRTIQRLETSDKAPKGHSLTAIAAVFNVEPVELSTQYEQSKNVGQSDLTAVKLINLGGLGFFIVPFGNILLTYYLWRKKGTSQSSNDAGRRILNFQILWSILLCFLLSIAPFIDDGLPFSLIFPFLFGLIFINLLVVLTVAARTNQGDLNFLNLPIRVI